jgi:CDGSH-type Zn-finger protein/uncharacterized Fe-S cluster protein YjdI
MSRRTYESKDIDVSFDGKLCIHARECVTTLPEVFEANAPGDWIHPDHAAAERIAALACNCPSGAIQYQRKDGGPAEAAPDVNRVKVRENGPLAFHADINLDAEAAGYRLTLCRCGASTKKPYCDGSHTATGFTASGEPASKDLVTLEERGGSLEINPAPNGPLLVNGPVEIMTGTGRCVERTTETALCRCGASENKPYCDGSHQKVGFRSEK